MTEINEILISNIDFKPAFIDRTFDQLSTVTNSKEYKGYNFKYKLGEEDIIGIEGICFTILKQDKEIPKGKVLGYAYVAPEWRGKDLSLIMIEFIINELGIKPIFSDKILSPANAKQMLSLTKSGRVKISIYDVETDRRIKYNEKTPVFYSVEQFKAKSNMGADVMTRGKYRFIMEDGRIVKGVNTTQDVGVDEIKKQSKKFGNSVSSDGYPKYSFRDSVKKAGDVLKEALEQIDEIYVGDFDLDDHEVSYYFGKLDRAKAFKKVKSGDYEIKIGKWPEGYWVIGISDIGFIVVSKERDLKYLQWTRSYVNPEHRGKGILELLLKTALDNGLKPLVTDYTLSIPAAKHFNKILSSSEFKVNIYDVEDDIILPYKPDAKIYHSPEGELGSEHDGAEYKDAEKYVWMIESKDFIDQSLDDILNEITSQKIISFEIINENNKLIKNSYDADYNKALDGAVNKINSIFNKETKNYVPNQTEAAMFNYHDNSVNSIREGIEYILSELKRGIVSDKHEARFLNEYNVSYRDSIITDLIISCPNKIRIIKETFDEEIDSIAKNHFNGGTNYYLNLYVGVDSNSSNLVIIVNISKNKSNKKILNTLFRNKLHISFNYKEEIERFIFDLKMLKSDYDIKIIGIPIEDLVPNKKNLREGGGAFKNPKVGDKLRRIKREEIDKTLHFLANTFTASHGMDYDYLKSHMMGSAGKQADSGDLDIVVDSSKYSRETLVSISKAVRGKYGVEYTREDGLNAGHLNLAIPIEGDDANGLIQVDLLLGQPEWMKFTHHSPGNEVSQYKGVFISQALGVIARMKKIWRHRDEKGERVGEINWAYDLEKGLHVRVKLRKKPGQGMSVVTPEEFESFPWHKYGVNPPRVPRYGYIDNPAEVVKILLGKDITPEDISTFEGLMEICRKRMGKNYPIFVDRLKDSLKRSSAQAGMPKVDIDNLKIFETFYIDNWNDCFKTIVENERAAGTSKLKFLEYLNTRDDIPGSKSDFDAILRETFSNGELEKWLNQFVKKYSMGDAGYLIEIFEMLDNLKITEKYKTLDDNDIELLNTHTPSRIQNGFCYLFFPNKNDLDGFKTQLKLLFSKDYRNIFFK